MLGPSLDDVFEATKRRFSIRTVFLIALQTLERLQYIHAKGVVHGDVKGENFLIGLSNEGLDNGNNRHNLHDDGLFPRRLLFVSYKTD